MNAKLRVTVALRCSSRFVYCVERFDHQAYSVLLRTVSR